MNPFKSFSHIFRKSPLVRVILLGLIVVDILIITTLKTRTVTKTPEITSITPPIGSPGDVLVINGSNFGLSRNTSTVEIAGSKITSSGYIDWQDNQIKIVLPYNILDGLVYVKTSTGTSNAKFFANVSSIPQPVKADPRNTMPVISNISPSSANVGEIITITGSNFGSTRSKSKVYFSANRESPLQNDSDFQETKDFIQASELNYDYEYWSDTEIQVHVPDGAGSGTVFIKTEKGSSERTPVTIVFPAGRKTYNASKSYIISVSTELQAKEEYENEKVTLFIPRPPVSALQPCAELREVNPEPMLRDDLFDIIHQVNLSDTERHKFTQNFTISTYSMNSNINPKNIARYGDRSRLLYSAYTSQDNCVPSENENIKKLSQQITANSRNPYYQAELIYDYMVENFKVLNSAKVGEASPLELLEKSAGDSYDFAIIFTALCRSAGIPAVPVGGVLVNTNSTTQNHWWSEIYFENYGWFPVDTALGAGKEFSTFNKVEAPKNFYFGNMDNQHITFSLGWKEIKASAKTSRTVKKTRTFALQSTWEEASNSELKYSSLWNDPVITGIY